VCIGIVRLKFDGLIVTRQSFVELALFLERIAEVEIAFGIFGFDANRLPIRGDRFVKLALGRQRIAEVGIRCCRRDVRIERSRAERIEESRSGL
jgi:hypothetical protein